MREQEVDNIQEAADAVVGVGADADERGGHVRGEPDSVLNIEALRAAHQQTHRLDASYDASVASTHRFQRSRRLRVEDTSINAVDSEWRDGLCNVLPEPQQEFLDRSMRELALDEQSRTKEGIRSSLADSESR